MRLAIAVALALALTTAAEARQDSPRQEAATLASQLMSPFCPGRLLVDCTSSQAYELRDTIAARLTAGETVAAVRGDLVRQYGHEILGAPDASGVGILAWLVPGVVALLSLLYVVRKVGTATRAGGRQPAHAVSGDARLLAQVDEALRDLD